MTLNKIQIIESISRQCGYSRKRSTQLFESLLEIIKSALESGEDILISGLGKFCVNDKGNRRGRNPQTGNKLMLEARRVVRFKCSRVLRDKMNDKSQTYPQG